MTIELFHKSHSPLPNSRVGVSFVECDICVFRCTRGCNKLSATGKNLFDERDLHARTKTERNSYGWHRQEEDKCIEK